MRLSDAYLAMMREQAEKLVSSGRWTKTEMESVLAEIQERRAADVEVERARAAALALLNDPREGLIVEGEGFRWVAMPVIGTQDICGWALDGKWEEGLSLYHPEAMPTLRALVSCGGATVRLPDGEAGS